MRACLFAKVVRTTWCGAYHHRSKHVEHPEQHAPREPALRPRRQQLRLIPPQGQEAAIEEPREAEGAQVGRVAKDRLPPACAARRARRGGALRPQRRHLHHALGCVRDAHCQRTETQLIVLGAQRRVFAFAGVRDATQSPPVPHLA
eukprot:6428282-Prymnesium_polylepis.2